MKIVGIVKRRKNFTILAIEGIPGHDEDEPVGVAIQPTEINLRVGMEVHRHGTMLLLNHGVSALEITEWPDQP